MTHMADVNPVLRLEWVHARANYNRWNEELHLLVEELRRIQVSFTKEAEARQARQPLEEFAALHYGDRPRRGYKAYGRKQAHAYTRLAESALEARQKLNLTTSTNLADEIVALTVVPPPPDAPATN